MAGASSSRLDPEAGPVIDGLPRGVQAAGRPSPHNELGAGPDRDGACAVKVDRWLRQLGPARSRWIERQPHPAAGPEPADGDGVLSHAEATEEHDPSDRAAAYALLQQRGLPLGVIYKDATRPTLQHRLEQIRGKARPRTVQELMETYQF